MPTGTGAVNQKNLPAVPFEINPALWASLTQKQVFNPTTVAQAPAANFVTSTLQQVGIVSRIRVLAQGSVVVAAATQTTPTYRWPYGMHYNVQLSGNQMNNFISVSGTDLYNRQVAQYRAFVDNVTAPGLSSTGTAVAGTYPFSVVYEIPVAMDMTSGIGSLYAQTEATNLTVTWTTDAIANLFTFTTGNPTLTNTAGTAGTNPSIALEETIFSLPYVPGKQGVLCIPDLTVLHGMIRNTNPVASSNLVTTFLYRNNANMERFFWYTDNNPGAGAAANVIPVATSNYANASLLYGANETPYAYNPLSFLKYQNNVDYRLSNATGRQIGSSAIGGLADGMFCLDFAAENPQRDQVILEGVTNLRLVTQYASTFTPNASAQVVAVQETLFA